METFLVFNSKLDHNSGLHAKIQREISSNKQKIRERGEIVLGQGEMYYRVKNCVSRPNVDDVRRQLQGPNKNVRKSRKKLGHNSGLHAKNKREISEN